MTKHYVEYLYPGMLFPEESIIEVPSRDPADLNIQELTGKPKNRSPKYYVRGEIFSVDDLKALNNPDLRILISNMEGNDWPNVIKCHTGNYQPFEAEDILLNP